ncbi:hypothetical protein SAMN05444166_0798 [Singulisphaera sp. GP187]|uniref:hypothetical protein n=1 Tax=Singulisphaera sp. GP187 TaxID=1882752 RepID=UPI000928C99A|nr:hypothetical protein [Singulisphaera sp. GP187]SIN77941.1 hypothetical protein SAMN05444166_0798 [Singulisphaera sp. GP187]
MSPSSESIHPQRHSLAWAMALIAVIGAKLAALRSILPLQISIFWTSYPWSVLREGEFLPPRFPNLGLATMVLVLEFGLFRLVTRRGGRRAFWAGFEIVGWAGVITCSVFARNLWWQFRALFEGSILGREIGRPLDMGRFVLFVSGLHLLALLPAALFAGMLARLVWHRYRPPSRQ